MTQEQLAEELNVARQTVSKWETGETVPDIDSLKKLANLLGFSIDKVLGIEVEDENDKTDNYYEGEYTVSFGDSAIDQINDEYGFNEEEFNKNTSILRTDIYYLELNRKKSVIDDKVSISTITTPYALFFYNASSDECEGMNHSTQNRV